MYAVVQRIIAESTQDHGDEKGSQPAVHVLVETSNPFSTSNLAEYLNSFVEKGWAGCTKKPTFLGGKISSKSKRFHDVVGILAIRHGTDNHFIRTSSEHKEGLLWTLNVSDLMMMKPSS